jgi:hypothetical protein
LVVILNIFPKGENSAAGYDRQAFDLLVHEGILNNELATNLKSRLAFEILQSTIIRALIGSMHDIVWHHLADFIEFAKVITQNVAMK